MTDFTQMRQCGLVQAIRSAYILVFISFILHRGCTVPGSGVGSDLYS